MTYALGWSVVKQMLVRRERWPGGYKTRPIALVRPGQEVQPDQPVLRREKAAPPEAIATVPHLSLPSVRTSGVHEPLGSTGIGNATPGLVATGGTPGNEAIPAGLRGRVIEITRRGGVIIESRAALVQGAIGAGNQVAGVLTFWQAPGIGSAQQRPIPPGALLVVPGPLNFAMLRQAMASGVSGVIASSISSHDLEGFLHADLVQLIGSADIDLAQAHLPPITLLFTEGLGTLAMPARTISLLNEYQGLIALLSGATSVRLGIAPELIISLPEREAQQNWHPLQLNLALAPGALVRICGGEYDGAIGEINYFFSHEQMFGSGIRARAAGLRLEDGSMIVVPLTLIERIA